MISVLIPTYNYNVYPLVKEIHKQISKQGIEFEILVFDDASTQKFENQHLIDEMDHVIYKKFKENQGRTAIRFQLAKNSKYENLLFLDADTFPKDRFFISKFIKTLEQHPADVYFGGIQVPTNPPPAQNILRWKYGKERESIPVEQRKANPYRSILCGALLIKKSVFMPIIKNLKELKMYGLDIYFSFQLKESQAKVYHFHNPIIHIGLETSKEFLQKTEQAIDTIHFLIQKKMIDANYTRLSQKVFQISKFGFCFPLGFLFKITQKICKQNLFSSNPSLFIFDVYKLCYFCQIRKN